MIEKGYVLPGMLAVGSDSHTTTYGAVGAFSTGIGRSEMAVIFATGKIWFRVPESMMINLAGRFSHRFISAKDLALTIIGEIGCDGGLYRSIEFTGSARKYLSVGDRMVLCNLAAEMGAKNGVVIPDEITENYCYTATKNTCEPVLPDSDARYEIKKTYDLNEIEPVVACPPDVDNVKKISDVKGLKFHQALLGTCTNGRFEDLKIAADIVKGRKIHRNVRFLVLPASRQIYSHAMETGILSILYDSGAVILNPGCGPCLGAHQGILAPSEVCLSTANRNFKGRMGCKDAFVYLASPAVVAASAIAGEFVDPREI
jgi:3-isopropylmalate dehydratase large subunit